MATLDSDTRTYAETKELLDAMITSSLAEGLKTAILGDESTDWYTGILSSASSTDAITASRQNEGDGATVAGYAGHVSYWLKSTDAELNGTTGPVEEDWSIVSVTPGEWDLVRNDLKTSLDAFLRTVRDRKDPDEEWLTTIITQIAHSAYHAGIVRQMLRRP
jgi:hypothetical protein